MRGEDDVLRDSWVVKEVKSKDGNISGEERKKKNSKKACHIMTHAAGLAVPLHTLMLLISRRV
jgi:hypothetical protein